MAGDIRFSSGPRGSRSPNYRWHSTRLRRLVLRRYRRDALAPVLQSLSELPHGLIHERHERNQGRRKTGQVNPALQEFSELALLHRTVILGQDQERSDESTQHIDQNPEDRQPPVPSLFCEAYGATLSMLNEPKKKTLLVLRATQT